MKNGFALGVAVLVMASLLGAPACRRQPQSRHYVENGTTDAGRQMRAPGPAFSAAWQWVTPPLWREEEGTGMRLATFSIPGTEGAGQCSLVPLPGDGGGIQANVQRWLGQLQLQMLSPQTLADFLSQQKTTRTAAGLPLTIIDFTPLSYRQQRKGISMLAAMIRSEDQTLFVKLSGGMALLEENRQFFYEFCRSLSYGA
jgi:hypothetical protein